jgi:uncharacterized membrane protein YeaQ/YmgE (transglycosylase-associated protein family)
MGMGESMYLSGESLLVILFVGLVAGWLAGKLVRGAGFGIIGDIVIGIIGAFIASWLFPRLGIHLGAGLVSKIIYSAIGAVICWSRGWCGAAADFDGLAGRQPGGEPNMNMNEGPSGVSILSRSARLHVAPFRLIRLRWTPVIKNGNTPVL